MTSPAPYSAIPEHLEGPLLTKAGEINPVSGRRWTNEELSRWLETDHRVNAGRMSVQRCLSRLRRERAAFYRDALGEELLDSLRNDWARLDLEAEELQRKVDELRDDPRKVAQYLACLAELRKLAATKAATVGRVADTDDLPPPVQVNVTVTDARSELAARLTRTAPGAVAEGAGGAGGEPLPGGG